MVDLFLLKGDRQSEKCTIGENFVIASQIPYYHFIFLHFPCPLNLVAGELQPVPQAEYINTTQFPPEREIKPQPSYCELCQS